MFVPSSAFRVIMYFSRLAFEATICPVWRSETPSILSCDVQSRPFLVWRSKPPCPLDCDVQSRLSRFEVHDCQFSLAIRAIVIAWHSWLLLLVWHSNPLHAFSLISSHSSFRHSEPLSIFHLAFRAAFSFQYQSHHLLHLAFRVVIHFPFGVRSLIFISISKPSPSSFGI